MSTFCFTCVTISWRRKKQEPRYKSVERAPTRAVSCMKTCPRFITRKWHGCEPGWSATHSAPRTPPGPPGTGRGWNHERRSAAPLQPCGPLRQLRRGLPRPLWQARAPERRWRRTVAEPWTQRIKIGFDTLEEHSCDLLLADKPLHHPNHKLWCFKKKKWMNVWHIL